MMVGKRNRLIAYLKKKNEGKYIEVADKLNLRRK
jgi:ribosomal protein S15P/S13E